VSFSFLPSSLTSIVAVVDNLSLDLVETLLKAAGFADLNLLVKQAVGFEVGCILCYSACKKTS
jgi:hypothetical protein